MITKDEIRKIFLDNGFTIKDGNDDLNDYVYDAAKALIDKVDLENPYYYLAHQNSKCKQYNRCYCGLDSYTKRNGLKKIPTRL